MKADLGVVAGKNLVVVRQGDGVVFDEPNLIALINRDGRIMVHAVGASAAGLAKAPPAGVRVLQPVRQGVIADYELAEETIKYALRLVIPRFAWIRPRMAAVVPGHAGEVERRALADALLNAGGRTAVTLDAALAAAIGAGLEVSQPNAGIVVDLGEDTIEVAAISNSRVQAGCGSRGGLDQLAEALVHQVRREHGVGLDATEGRELFRAWAAGEETAANGQPVAPTLISLEVGRWLDPIAWTLEEVIAASSAVSPSAIVLSGAGAAYPALVEGLARRAGVNVTVAAEPHRAIVRGLQFVLDNGGPLQADSSGRRMGQAVRR